MFEDQVQVLRPDSVEALGEILRDGQRVLPRGGGTKPALSTPTPGFTTLEMGAFHGIIEYEPDELTFTALAGTPVAQVSRMLAEHGQYLPFDPPLAGRGATLGGAVAAGVSGPGRYHYGGLRDFLLGVRFVDSQGKVVRGGGKVVKNAAGFDLPKLMIGSRGALGILVELSFKVFPQPEAYITFFLDCENLETALASMARAAAAGLALAALDIEAKDSGYRLWARLAGLSGAMPARQAKLAEVLAGARVVRGEEEKSLWRRVSELVWAPDGWAWVIVPLTPGRIVGLEQALVGGTTRRRYISGGQTAWIAFEQPPQALDRLLAELGLTGLILCGGSGVVQLGERKANPFLQRVKSALDPEYCFVEV
jgi:glycolate oxidase FAD binding subunit